jgi:hypothetical protein
VTLPRWPASSAIRFSTALSRKPTTGFNSDDAVAAMRGGIQANKHFKTRANGPQQHAMNAGVEAVFLEETLYGTQYIFHKHGIIVVG